ncbi:MAG: SGNH/GDSL hydrolase family protein [Scandinavium sp.]|uniref:SGNH/GDSL hydrolase family protein n=1 Tax=Scandinavium sp. TaxID=2830653 RepID=UPI003F3A2497
MSIRNPTSKSRETGSADTRDFPSWFSRVQRLSMVRTTPIPVMDNPPDTILTKGLGLSYVSVFNEGIDYSVGDNLTPAREAIFQATIRVTGVDEIGRITSVAVQKPGCYESSSSELLDVTGGTGSGARFTASYNAGVASAIYNGKTTQRQDETAFDYLGYDIQDNTSGSGYRGNGVQNGTQCQIAWVSDAPYLELRLIGGNYQGDLYVNGARISAEAIKTDTSGSPYLYAVDWAGVSDIREYRLCGINTGFGGINTELQYSIWTPDENHKPIIWIMGDSYTVGIGATQGSFNYFRIMCDALGAIGLADGISGAGWTSIQPDRIPQQRVEMKLGSITRQPNFVFFAMGYNDANAGHIELLKTNFRASVKKVRELCPLAQIVNIGPATPLGKASVLTAIREAEMELCEELAIPYIDIDDWVNQYNKQMYTGSDNTHPTDAGHAFIGIREAKTISKII